MNKQIKNRNRKFSRTNPKAYEGNDNSRRERTHKAADLKGHIRIKDSGGDTMFKSAFTLIELIVVMAVIGILVLIAAPKFLGYTQKAQDTKHIHTAKVIETALEAYLIHGGEFPTDLEVVDPTSLSEAATNKNLIGVDGYISTLDGETYYELTYDFIQKLDVKLSASSTLFIEAMASTAPTALYASEKGITLVDKDKTLKGYTLQPGEIPNEVKPETIAELEMGDSHSLLLKKDGTVWSWGLNSLGQLGIGNNTTPYNTPQEITFFSGMNIKSIAVGDKFSMALLADGSVYSWGGNVNGELGLGDNLNRNIPTAVSGLSGKDVQAISAGSSHGLALCSSGEVLSWGHNINGQLGLADTVSRNTPSTISTLTGAGIKKIVTKYAHSFAIDNDGKVWAWGRNDTGQLGVGSIANSTTPIKLTAFNTLVIEDISVGVIHSVATTSDNRVFAWGNSEYGQLGVGTIANQTVPYEIASLAGRNISSTTSGAYHTMALSGDGKLLIWGRNYENQLGFDVYPVQKTPYELTSVSHLDIKYPLAGGFSSSIILSDGTIWVWGTNNSGQLGLGNVTNQIYPVENTLINID